MQLLLEIIGAGLTLASVLTAVREHRATWLFAGGSAVLYAFVYWRAGLPVSAEVQLVYLVSSVYGWLHWGDATGRLRPRSGSLRLRLVTPAVTLGLAAALYRLNGGATAGAAVGYDALLVAAALTAQLLMTRKYISCWWYWLVVNLGYLPLLYGQQLWVTLAVYLVLLPQTVRGARDWYARRTVPSATALP